MRVGYMIAAVITLIGVGMSIFLISSPRWIIDYRRDGSQTNYGLFVYEVCAHVSTEKFCWFAFYSKKSGSSNYAYYKAGTMGAAFMLTGTILMLLFMILMFIKSSSGLAGRMMGKIFNNYYLLYYFGFFAAICKALGWGLYYHYVPHTYKFRYPFWLYMVTWICFAIVVLAVFMRKILQGNAKKGGWMSIT